MPQKISNLAVGSKVAVPVKAAYQSFLGSKIVFKVADKNHSGYPSNSVTLIADKIVSVLAFDAMEASNSDENRQRQGNNRYLHANLLQWLNSNAAAGNWYSAQHSADAPPTAANVNGSYNPYDSKAGFLAMLEDDFVGALLSTTVTTVKNTATDGGGYETVTSKVFLASTTEVGLANENNIAEGSLLALFSDDTSRLAYPATECVRGSNYTHSSFNTSAAWHWWLRTPHSANPFYVRVVNTSGALTAYSAYYGYLGVRPLGNLSADLSISDVTDSDGCYAIVYNWPPAISGSDTDLGSFAGSPPNYEYTVTDEDGHQVTVVEMLNGATLRNYTATLGSTNTLTIGADTWLALPNGSHTLTIRATDALNESTTRTLTFTKNVTAVEFEQTLAMAADAMPTKALVNVQGSFPVGCAFTVEICNNGNDPNPAWEDITTKATTGQKHFFTNTAKTAANWGVKVRVKLLRGTATMTCYIQSVGGNFA